MSGKDCLICCDALFDNSLDIQNTETLFRTLFGHPLEFLSDKDSFQLLFQSATYCSECVGKVQDLAVLFRELEALEKKLDDEKAQIKNQIRQGCVFYDWNRKSDSVDNNHNQKFRKRIVARMNEQEGTTDPLNTEGQQLLQSISEVEIPNIEDNFSPPSPTHSITSLISLDEEKFLPQELSTIGHELTTLLTEGSQPTINPEIRQIDKTMGSGLQLSNKDSQCDKRLPVIILHKLGDAETKAALRRNKIRKRYAEVKPVRSNIRKLRDKKIKNGTSTRMSAGHERQPSETVEIEISESNSSIQLKANIKRKRMKLKEPRTRCPFYPGCLITFAKDEEINLKAHVRKRHEGMKNGYLCEIENCEQSFGTLKELQTHESWKHKGIHPYICPHCEEVCTSKHHFKLHIAVNHKPEEIKFNCEFCGQAFINQRKLTLHLMKHTKKRPFMCEICSKTFNTNQYLKFHQSKHHAEVTRLDPYKCDECGRIFAAPQNLRDHIKRLHRREFKYQCEICGRGSLTPSGLKQHINQCHSDEKNFKCEQCGSCFKVKHGLTVHIRTHTGERPYICKTESCGKTFTDIGKLRRHELIHSKEQCHVCKICGKTFPVRNYLYIHMRSHNKNRPNEPKLKLNCSEGSNNNNALS